MSKVFISYAYADGADIARQLVSELEAAGSPCWIGQRDMKTGEDFPPQIVRAIRECQALVVLLTPKANGSRDVLQEVSLAHNAQKPMVPIAVRATQPSDGLAYYVGIVQQVHWEDARTAAAAVLAVVLTAQEAEEAARKEAECRKAEEDLRRANEEAKAYRVMMGRRRRDEESARLQRLAEEESARLQRLAAKEAEKDAEKKNRKTTFQWLLMWLVWLITLALVMMAHYR